MESYVDYMLVLSPPENIAEIINFYKKDAAKKIGKYESMCSIPHITIEDYHRQKPFITDQAMLRLAERLKLMPPVRLGINGLDYFNHSYDIKTLYAAIPSTPDTVAWFKLLKKHLNLKKRIVPHITIARNIPDDAFTKLWHHYKQVKLAEPFVIDKLTVLRRDTFNNFAPWAVFTEIPFKGRHLISELPPKSSLLKPLSGNYAASQQTSLF